QEQETEKENERETEQETEREKEQEKEQEAEKEKEKEEEQEDEEEHEEEIELQTKEIKEIGKELKEIKQELKILNQNLGAIAKMFQDYLVHEGVYLGPVFEINILEHLRKQLDEENLTAEQREDLEGLIKHLESEITPKITGDYYEIIEYDLKTPTSNLEQVNSTVSQTQPRTDLIIIYKEMEAKGIKNIDLKELEELDNLRGTLKQWGPDAPINQQNRARKEELEKKYSKDPKSLFTEEEAKQIDGGKLDLSEYPNLEKITISGEYLKSPLTELELGEKPKLYLLYVPDNRLISLVLNETLDISNTDIDSGLEYLPDSVKKFKCSTDKRPDTKAKAIYDLFANDQGKDAEFKIQLQEAEEYNKTLSDEVKFPQYQIHHGASYHSKLLPTKEISRLLQDSQ
ncbi:6530_t:CDS:2, partial [Racocetra persica]